jgi:hypothetical protein
MSEAKDLVVRLINSKTSHEFVRKHHYSGKTKSNSNVHFGVYLQGRLEGVLQFGPSNDKQKMIGLVRDTKWDEFIELNRMAFTDALPRNSESRALSVCFRILRKHAPHLKWIISFADATQCGDGTIYRASGFVLTSIKENDGLVRLPSGEVIHKIVLHSNPTMKRPELGGRSFYDVSGGRYSWKAYLEATGAQTLPGFQLRYIYFLDPAWRDRLVPDALPFSQIDLIGAGLYKGAKITQAERSVTTQAREA